MVTAWCNGRHGRVHVMRAVVPRVAHDKVLTVRYFEKQLSDIQRQQLGNSAIFDADSVTCTDHA